jgi:hypothetical protein
MRDHELVKNECRNMLDKGLPKAVKTKWGPTLVDKRPSRNKPDGRTVLEKAQERKKITNLEVYLNMLTPSMFFLIHIFLIELEIQELI